MINTLDILSQKKRMLLSLWHYSRCLNLLDISNILDINFFTENYIRYIFLMALLIVFNLFRYLKFVELEVLENKWREEKKNVKIIKCVLLLVYVLLSFLFLSPKFKII